MLRVIVAANLVCLVAIVAPAQERSGGSALARLSAQADVERRSCVPDHATLKSLALDVIKREPDAIKFQAEFDRAVGVNPMKPIRDRAGIVTYSEELSIFVFFPYESYKSSLDEAIRKREPVNSVGIPAGVQVAVSPSRIDAPDIIKVVVERDGKEVPPLINLLVAKVLETGLGAKRVLHAGTVFFSCSTFAIGATVTVTAIPESGTNIVKTFTSEQLADYK